MNYEEANELIRRAIDEANPRTDKEYAEVIAEILSAISGGEDDYVQGMLKMRGVMMPQKREEAYRHFLSAAERGHRASMLAVAACYLTGHGTERDLAAARSWYRKLAEVENAKTRHFLEMVDACIIGIFME